MSAVIKNDKFEQILDQATIIGKIEFFFFFFYPRHNCGGQKWQHWAKSCIGPTLKKKWYSQIGHVRVVQKWQFGGKYLIVPTLLEKFKFSSSTCPLCSKITIWSKIMDRANILGKIEIFILDMSTVIKNYNFKQNPGSVKIFLKIKFSSSTCSGWSKMTILSKTLDRANIFENVIYL